MADTVAYHMERMLPELEDLEKRELFSRDEIKEIVRQRHDFEYLLKRPSALKQDFLRYVEHEMQLEAVRKARKHVLCAKLPKGENWRGSISDRSCSMRIMSIYERAVTRFKGDLELWLRYAEFCRTQGSRRVQKVLMKAIQLHPAVPGLWIYASVWEAEHNSNVTAARALMQQGLRSSPKSEILWLEYFRMELIFAEKVKARRLVLGISAPETPAITEAGEGEEEEGKVLSSNTDGVEEEKEEGKVQVSHQAASIMIAQVIYRKAITEIPNSVRLRQRFLEILESIDVEKLMALEGEIYAGLREDFVTDEETWAWLARRQFVKAESKGMTILDCRQESIQVYEEALQSVPSARMYELYAEFFIDNLEHDDDEFLEVGDHASEKGPVSTLEQSAEALLTLYKRAKAAGLESESLAQGQAGLLLRWGNVDRARESLEVTCKENASTCGSARIWTFLLSLEAKRTSVKALDSSEQIAKLLKAAFKNASDDDKDLLQIAAEVQTFSRKPFDGFLRLLEGVLAENSGKQSGAEVAAALVDWVLHAEGLQRAREIYTRLIALPNPGLQFLKSCIAMEARLVSDGDAEALRQLRKLFNNAVELHGHHDDSLWLEFCAQERKAGNIEEASNIYWRAKKALNNPSNFLEKYQLLR